MHKQGKISFTSNIVPNILGVQIRSVCAFKLQILQSQVCVISPIWYIFFIPSMLLLYFDFSHFFCLHRFCLNHQRTTLPSPQKNSTFTGDVILQTSICGSHGYKFIPKTKFSIFINL